jgi:hypothetical protein
LTICSQLVHRSAAAPVLFLALVTAGFTPAAVRAEDLPPRFREAVDLFLAGDYQACQNAFSEAAGLAPRAGLAARAAYGAACCAALRLDADGAFAALSLALSNGFVDLERALTDPRLETLRSDSRWFNFVAVTEERQQARLKTLDPDLLRLYLEKRNERPVVDRDLPATAPNGAPTPPTSGGAQGPAKTDAVDRGLARRREAWELVEKGRVQKPEDAFHAAVLLVESDRPAEVERAAALARQALAGDPDLFAARPLVATAVDRGEMLAGRPQKYGTQLVQEGGVWAVYTVDPKISDAERAEWGVPPLAQTQARVAELNRPPAPASPAAPPKP